MAHAGGRPTNYCPEICAYICKIVSTNPYGLKKLTRLFPGMPSETTINEWRHDHDECAVEYNKAKLKQADLLAEECLDIADDVSEDTIISDEGFERCNTEFVNRSRLRIDTRKWLASKLLPKQYGDKKEIEQLQGENERVKAELAALRDKLDKANVSEY